jgi:citronellyl-CoA dehydrogenase
MKFTSEHNQISDTVRKFVANEINPFTKEWEKAGQFPAHELFKKLGDLGLLGIKYPTEFGGMGLDFSYSMVMAEALGDCNVGGVPMAIGVQTDMCTPALARFGSDALRQEFLAPAIAGDMVGCIGVSEAGGGSDVAALKTRAEKDGDDYIINGSKMWITNGMQADWCCLLANTSEGAAHKNKSLIMVPMNSPGITRQKIEKIGMDSSDTAQLFFDNVRVPRRNVIGQEGMGFMLQMLQFQEERLYGAAGCLRSLDNLIDQTINYTRQRHTFGRPILDNQVVHFRLAELRTEVEALARPHLPRRRILRLRQGRHPSGLHGQAQGRTPEPRSGRQLPAVLGRHGFHSRQPDLTVLPRRAADFDRWRRRRNHAGHHLQARGHAARQAGLRRDRIAMTYETLLARRQGPALELTLNRPQSRNAMSLAMVAELQQALAQAEQTVGSDDAVRVIVLRGAAGHFCSGGDLKDMSAARLRAMQGTADGTDPIAEVNARFGHLCAAFARSPLAIIALLEGTVMGGGFGLACVADVAIATETASFRLPETSLGVVPAQIAPFLVERLGYSQAKRLAVTGGRLDAAAALRIGLVHQQVDSGQLQAALDAVLADILACGPGALAATKALMAKARLQAPASLIDEAAAVFSRAAQGTEAMEGMGAFLQKRKPNWVPG